MVLALLFFVIGFAGLLFGFWAGCDFSKFRVREAEKRERAAKQDRDALQQWLDVTHKCRIEMREVADAAIAQLDAADLVIDRILSVIHDAREKQAEASEAMCAAESTSGQ